MRRSLALLLVSLVFALTCAPQGTAAPPPAVAGKAVLVADGRTGDILYERDADRRLSMASITKLMTALVVLDHARPGELVTVRGTAPAVAGSTIYLRTGERVPVRDLLAAALIQSANDAAYALAAHVGKGSISRFVRLMNAKAEELGLADSRYARPDGLDAPGHYSSARDSFRLARLAMQQPLVRRLVRMRTARIAGGRSLHTWNDLLGTFPGLIGVKTGHTDRAGWSQVAAARRDGTPLYAVILDSPSRERRNADLAALLDWGFDRYGRMTIVRDAERYATAAIPFSEERLELVAEGGAETVVRLDEGLRFVERVVAPAMVELPVEKGERLGEVVILEGDGVVARRPLVAARAVPEPGFGERTGWYAERALDEAGDMLATVLPGLG